MMFSDRFSSENFMMSVVGHLALVAVMITSFAVVMHRAQLVAPDRIQILEIDLDSVQVSGDDTILYNVNEETADAEVAEEPSPAPEPAPVPEPAKEETAQPEPVEEQPIETPSLVEEKKPEPVVSEEKTEEKTEEKPVEEKKEEPVKQEESKEEKKPEKKDDIVAPKKKRVVRVNREVVSLNRTLTVSVVDALRVAMTRCWVIDTGRADVADIRAVAHLTLRKNGTVRDVWFESAAREKTDPAFAYVLETIRSAIDVCQPFKMLPENEFEKWEKIQLTFYPNQGKVM